MVKAFWSCCVPTLYSRTLSGNASLFVPECRAAIHYRKSMLKCISNRKIRKHNFLRGYLLATTNPLLSHKIAHSLPSLPLVGALLGGQEWLETVTGALAGRIGAPRREWCLSEEGNSPLLWHQLVRTFSSFSASVPKHCGVHLTRERAGMRVIPVRAGRDEVRKLLLCPPPEFRKLSSCLSWLQEQRTWTIITPSFPERPYDVILLNC